MTFKKIYGIMIISKRKGKNYSGPEERRVHTFHSIYCPKSGNLLMKCTCGVSQIVCPKCRAVIVCKIIDDRVEVYEDRRTAIV